MSDTENVYDPASERAEIEQEVRASRKEFEDALRRYTEDEQKIESIKHDCFPKVVGQLHTLNKAHLEAQAVVLPAYLKPSSSGQGFDTLMGYPIVWSDESRVGLVLA
jgi:hypothetical protein